MIDTNKAGKTSVIRSHIPLYIMIAPFALIFTILTILPILASLFFGFTSFDSISMPQWVGLENYFRMFSSDDVFPVVLKNTILMAVITGPIGFLMSFALAWFVSEFKPFTRTLLSFMFYAPSLSGDSFTKTNLWINSQEQFNGHFDGDSHVIYGLYFPTNANISVAFIPTVMVSDTGSVKNLGISHAELTSGFQAASIIGIVNYVGTSFEIDNCFADDTVSINGNWAGGIIGWTNANPKTTVKNTYFTGNVVGANATGGIIGYLADATPVISDSYVATANGDKVIGSEQSITYSHVYSTAAEDKEGVTTVAGGTIVGAQARDNMVFDRAFDNYWQTNNGTPILKSFADNGYTATGRLFTSYDINGDGKLNILDLVRIKKISLKGSSDIIADMEQYFDEVIQAEYIGYHRKLLSDGLLNFAGSGNTLGKKIVENFFDFSVGMQVTLLDYLRFSGSEYQKFALSLLINEDLNDEIRYASIRYLGKYPFSKAYEVLCGFAEENSEQKWEYAAIASTALGSYPCENTVHILKKNLYSRNWYVRLNSAASLKNLGITYSELSDIIDGNDRYASEIIRYCLQRDYSGEKEAVHI